MRRVPLMVAVPLMGLALAGCGRAAGPGVATADGSTGHPSASPSLDRAAQWHEFGNCMRSHGVQMDDPDPNDPKITLKAGGRKGSGAAKAALQACRRYLPNGGQPRKANPQQLAAARKLAACMRANGVPDFPDPGPDGGFRITKGGGLDPGDLAFKAAMDTCKKYGPKAGKTTEAN
ncbi:hypothetical protein Athai_62910 [Actinocatenispora thailandica]|uniref:Lipoprotein n=1 Tax=Actinocatenispora thailandica TaxID=227318 RepID=A0A7R7DVS5_9ACTN|nr:hypothetical protein [Actinocatenispora thailandica]BCJ38788.1 hypothetical protein Athai_62910 [Actinocatenispora thailandica]